MYFLNHLRRLTLNYFMSSSFFSPILSIYTNLKDGLCMLTRDTIFLQHLLNFCSIKEILFQLCMLTFNTGILHLGFNVFERKLYDRDIFL